MFHQRASGILLHISSLRGNEYIGTFGKEAFEFADFLSFTNQKYWQILPLGPTGYGNCPYQSFSAHAGNPYFISIEKLIENGWLKKADAQDLLNCKEEKVNYGLLAEKKEQLLKKFFLAHQADFITKNDFQKFCEENSYWLHDYAIFMALKKKYQTVWNYWESEYKFKYADAIRFFEDTHKTEIVFEKFLQYLFFEQWLALKQYLNQKGVQVIGDLPIYVSYNSADCWAERHLFSIDENGNPIEVAGVPPDYFSEFGQLWGNPVYNWAQMQNENFLWWQKRFNTNLKLFDVLRLDHFRGFAGYWAIPYGEPTAINGQWKKAPGKKLFEHLFSVFHNLQVIAEDLGIITDDVKELMHDFKIPGMKVLQFAFDTNAHNEFLPHNYSKECVAYTGTHDNDTIIGWYNNQSKKTKKFIRQYLQTKKKNLHKKMVRTIWESVAAVAIVPMQDLLAVDSCGRMNYPGTAENNWEWRLPDDWQDLKMMKFLHNISKIYGRC